MAKKQCLIFSLKTIQATQQSNNCKKGQQVEKVGQLQYQG